jgi:hypothetical protein
MTSVNENQSIETSYVDIKNNLKLVIDSEIEFLIISKDELYVQFKSGATYTYSGVSESVYAELCEAESFGKFLNSNIKGTYSYLKS